jgi:type VI protein secretion system component VasF
MDHHEQHHQHHEKERQHRIEQEKERERKEEKSPSQIHPAWFIAAGVVLIVLVILTWLYVNSLP